MKPKAVVQNSGEGMQKKKFSKPLMERRRRARINDSLNELKVLVLRSLKKDPSRYSKMEKADILELTVKYLKALCGSKQVENDEHQSHFLTGYNECAREVQLYLLRSADVSPHVKAQMLSRISTSPSESHQLSPINSSLESSTPLLTSSIIPSPVEHRTPPVLHTPMTSSTSKSMNLPSSSPKSAFTFSFPSPPASPIIPDHVSRSELENLPFSSFQRSNMNLHLNSLECKNYFVDKCTKLSQSKAPNDVNVLANSCHKASKSTPSCRKELWRPW